jgi:hypothetical protein
MRERKRTMTETIPYEITGTAGEIEFRKYPALVLATVDSAGDDSGFNLLFAYITGTNTAHHTLSMTAPVITSTKIPMTAPVVSDARSMSFVMPPGKNRDEIPDPLDSRVRIVPLPEREVAVIRFRGRAPQEEVAAAEERLREGLRDAGIEPVGGPFLMRYNPPWTPGFLRRNEVGMEIKR